MTTLRQDQWEKLLNMWSDANCGEERLICAVLAESIAEEIKAINNYDLQRPFQTGFFAGGFQTYAMAIGLNPVFVIEQVKKANEHREPA